MRQTNEMVEIVIDELPSGLFNHRPLRTQELKTVDIPTFVHDDYSLVYLELISGHSIENVPIIDDAALEKFSGVLKKDWIPVLFK